MLSESSDYSIIRTEKTFSAEGLLKTVHFASRMSKRVYYNGYHSSDLGRGALVRFVTIKRKALMDYCLFHCFYIQNSFIWRLFQCLAMFSESLCIKVTYSSAKKSHWGMNEEAENIFSVMRLFS